MFSMTCNRANLRIPPNVYRLILWRPRFPYLSICDVQLRFRSETFPDSSAGYSHPSPTLSGPSVISCPLWRSHLLLPLASGQGFCSFSYPWCVTQYLVSQSHLSNVSWMILTGWMDKWITGRHSIAREKKTVSKVGGRKLQWQTRCIFLKTGSVSFKKYYFHYENSLSKKKDMPLLPEGIRHLAA